MHWRKAALVTTVSLTALFACGAATLHVLVDPERIRKLAADRARSAWGRELLVGDVSFHLFPAPSVRASGVSFANPPWAHEPQLLQAERARADLEVLPLLVGKVRLKRLVLDGVKVGLEVADDGAASWQLRAPGGATPRASQSDDPLRIASIAIRNAHITHRKGRETGSAWTVDEALIESEPGFKDLRLDARLSRNEVAVQVKAKLADASGLNREGATTQGELDIKFAAAALHAEGLFPLHRLLKGQDLAASLEAESLHDVLRFFGIQRNRTAAVQLRLRAREEAGRIEVSDLAASLGTLKVTGRASVTRDPRINVAAQLKAGRIEWLKTLADAGGTIRPPRRDGEVFHEDPVGWRVVTSLGALHGVADLDVASLRLGNGLELANFRTRMSFGDGRLQMTPFSAQMLGGQARGGLHFDGTRKAVRFELDGEGLLLERWFHERGSKIPFKGGPMKVEARLDLGGATYRELAASVTGRFAARMGPGVWSSQRAGEAEEVMVRALQPKDGQDVAFQCAALDLHFKSGRATGPNLVGARSDVSQLLTSGNVDIRAEALDLRGRVISRSGTRMGIASLAGDVQITGSLAKPTMRLDPDARPAILARAGAAIASAGVSLLGSALVDVAESQNDPCLQVGRRT